MLIVCASRETDGTRFSRFSTVISFDRKLNYFCLSGRSELSQQYLLLTISAVVKKLHLSNTDRRQAYQLLNVTKCRRTELFISVFVCDSINHNFRRFHSSPICPADTSTHVHVECDIDCAMANGRWTTQSVQTCDNAHFVQAFTLCNGLWHFIPAPFDIMYRFIPFYPSTHRFNTFPSTFVAAQTTKRWTNNFKVDYSVVNRDNVEQPVIIIYSEHIVPRWAMGHVSRIWCTGKKVNGTTITINYHHSSIHVASLWECTVLAGLENR